MWLSRSLPLGWMLGLGCTSVAAPPSEAASGFSLPTDSARVLDGEVAMEKNFTLEPWEIEKGFVLTCQARPLTASVTVSYDER